METTNLPILKSTREKQLSARDTSLSSLSSIKPSHLPRDLCSSENEVQENLRVASCRVGSENRNGSYAARLDGSQNAWEMLQKEESSPRITTSCADLDEILGGGFNCNEVTEVGGVPGVGKTQLGIQLAVNVQIPANYGGLEGKAIYIDTEGSFMVERVLQIAEACVEDLQEYSRFLRKDFLSSHHKMQPKDFLDNIFYFRICSCAEQIAVINYLETFVSNNKDVKVVIIDSITFHFRYNFDDMALRTRLLGEISLKLMKLAKKFSLAVVLTNHVITKYADGSFHLTLALGDSWSHACTNRIILSWKESKRYAYIDKSPSVSSGSAEFCITERGIRNSVSGCKRVKML